MSAEVVREAALDGSTVRSVRIGATLHTYAEADAIARKTTAPQAREIRDCLERIAIEEE